MADSAWTGGTFGSVARCVLAPNASPMTLDGTNTWVLRAPDSSRSVVVDPGPPDPGHLDAVASVAGEVAVVLLTHHHLDHSEAARAFAERVGCGVRALDPAYRLGSEGLGEGDVVAVDEDVPVGLEQERRDRAGRVATRAVRRDDGVDVAVPGRTGCARGASTGAEEETADEHRVAHRAQHDATAAVDQTAGAGN